MSVDAFQFAAALVAAVQDGRITELEFSKRQQDMADLAIKGDMPAGKRLALFHKTAVGAIFLRPRQASPLQPAEAMRRDILKGYYQTGVEITKRVETTEAFERLKCLGEELRIDGDTDAQAFVKAINQRPDLYQQDRDERLVKAAGVRPGEENPASETTPSPARHQPQSIAHKINQETRRLMKEAASKGQRMDRDHAFSIASTKYLNSQKDHTGREPYAMRG